MDLKPRHDLAAITPHFLIHGQFRSAEPYGSGHINDTYCAVYDQAGALVRYVFQRINHAIFRNPPAVMENIRRVTDHIRAKLAGQPELTRRVLTLLPTRTGRDWHLDPDGNTWRAYLFIEHARTYDAIESERQAFEAARSFGAFQQQLADLPAPPLHETIPDFHHTPRRFKALEKTIAADSANRAASARPEIDFAVRHKPITSALLDLNRRGLIPTRTTHNDTKLNNVMLDDATGQGFCIIDLDTVMPGLALYDFGDMVRTSTSPAREDEQDLAKVRLQFPMYEALVRGFLETAGTVLTPTEKQHLAFAGKLITFEIGIRFLADYLAGDVYFKTHRPGHNLDRCRTQFKLVESIEQHEEAMNRLVEGR